MAHSKEAKMHKNSCRTGTPLQEFLNVCEEPDKPEKEISKLPRSGGNLRNWYLGYKNVEEVILTPKFRSDWKLLVFLYFGSEKNVGGAGDLSRGGFRPPPPLADNPVIRFCM